MMNRLLWREFLEYFFINKNGKKQTIVQNILYIGCYVVMLYIPHMLGHENGYLLIGLMTIAMPGYFLGDEQVQDVMYMLPGTIENYYYARLKFTIRIQLVLLAVFEVARLGFWSVGFCGWNMTEEIFFILSTIIYCIANGVYVFYRTYTYKPFYKEIGGMAVYIPWILIIGLEPETGDTVAVIFIIRVILLVLFAGYACFVCRFVKKNILFTREYGGENT